MTRVGMVGCFRERDVAGQEHYSHILLFRDRSPSLEDSTEGILDVAQGTLLGLLVVNELGLDSVIGEISHAREDIDIPCSDEQRSV